MLASIRLALQILRALLRIGLLSFRPSVPMAFLRAWWRCGNSYACLAEFAARRFPHRLYGSTEAGIIALATPQELREAPGTVGRPLLGNRVRIAPGTSEVQVQGPLVVAPPENPWYGTGDVGRLDGQGRLFVCGRLDAMLVSGGENVYPHETESALLEHPDVAEVAIVPIEDPEFGQAMLAWVVPNPGRTIDGRVLRDWLRQRLERCKLPRDIRVAKAIPRNALGKVDQVALRALTSRW